MTTGSWDAERALDIGEGAEAGAGEEAERALAAGEATGEAGAAAAATGD